MSAPPSLPSDLPSDLPADALGACRALGVDSENAPQRGQFLPDSPPHSGTMGQEDGKKWAAAAHSQPTIPKSDRLLVLGIETSCDETGVALVRCLPGGGVPALLAHALHSQITMHQAYGGVVPELASRDHIRRVLPLTEEVLAQAGVPLAAVDVVAYTRGPGLAGALLVGAGVACALAAALGRPVLGVHHLEGHLLSPFLSADAPEFPFVALLVSGGHTQLMRVDGVGRYTLLGETIDDAAGEAFDKSAKLLGLGYPGGPALSRLAEQGDAKAFALPRPLLHSGNLDFSFAGLKTAVLTQAKKLGAALEVRKADLAASTEAAIVDVLVHKTLAALRATGLTRVVVAGGVGANRRLRAQLDAACAARRVRVHYPELHLCTDNGAMIALAAAMRLQAGRQQANSDYAFDVKPRWPLETLDALEAENS
ncbi:tRNA (adenosine(37)-N6)-threonylcarbamoyltransferase complex transferase subunit TsaD [Extensimonas sp. H3M7-6]|uniref:tRNA (adenosine(37)-N6)-threonylcarbamoyltransferase complex transferase subunit TsaD n=1 Tax=Extensimonas soli TaxID=3031322 RepID=UPI0023DCC91F|nr:tRNA (adenosine(37)-N6)-threonylcarbamoyltransferase complex transferase subunit TsaD [Extensimonas sp. H3M7-6]MDF1480586.1 tRNA (adenosine(37)-N6)-threonylcarbamoyltransferase complex transferase subunit TsaD [Extensimonas sp. H3M7-6]